MLVSHDGRHAALLLKTPQRIYFMNTGHRITVAHIYLMGYTGRRITVAPCATIRIRLVTSRVGKFPTDKFSQVVGADIRRVDVAHVVRRDARCRRAPAPPCRGRLGPE